MSRRVPSVMNQATISTNSSAHLASHSDVEADFADDVEDRPVADGFRW